MTDTCVPPSQHARVPPACPPCEGAASPAAAGEAAIAAAGEGASLERRLGVAAPPRLVERTGGGEDAANGLHAACARCGSPSIARCSSEPG